MGVSMEVFDTYEKLIDKYLECAKIHYDIDYADKSSVKRGNKAVTTMIGIAKIINEKYPERIEDLSTLLNTTSNRVDIWVAHHILEHMNYSNILEKRALAVIKKYSKENTANGLGNRMWLDEWKKKKK